MGAAGTRPCTHESRLVSGGWSMSAFPPKRTFVSVSVDVRYVPFADMCGSQRPLCLGAAPEVPLHHVELAFCCCTFYFFCAFVDPARERKHRCAASGV